MATAIPMEAGGLGAGLRPPLHPGGQGLCTMRFLNGRICLDYDKHASSKTKDPREETLGEICGKPNPVA